MRRRTTAARRSPRSRQPGGDLDPSARPSGGRSWAWAAFACSLLLFGAALVMLGSGTGQTLTPDIVLFVVAYLTFGAVGAIIVSRQPTNRIGRLALLVCVLGSTVAALDSYTRLLAPVPFQDATAVLAAAGFPTTLGPILLLILLFPTGRLASPRWRMVVAILAVGTVLLAVGNLLSPTFADYPERRNPLGVPGFAGSPLEHGGVGWLFILVAAVAAPLGLVTRLRAARGVEREQLKWVTSAAAVHGLAWVLLALELPGLAAVLAFNAIFATLALIPIAAGIAVLRYRLYDIDLVIRRTLLYGVVVAILGGVYVTLVLVLQTLLSDAFGGGTVPVALSTLATAALFGRVRARVRAAIDRRFDRSRYDAERTLQALTLRLRDKVELDAVSTTLVDLARRAVQPDGASLWVRDRR